MPERRFRQRLGGEEPLVVELGGRLEELDKLDGPAGVGVDLADPSLVE